VVDTDFKIQYINKFTTDLLNTLPEIILEYRLGHDIQLSNLKDEPIPLINLNESTTTGLAISDIIYINFAGRRYPINNINITGAKFRNADKEQFLIMFNDARDSLKRLQKDKKENRMRLAAQIEGAENERLRVSRELHDGLGQMLNVVKMNTKSLITDSSIKQQLIELIDASIDESHKISENLMPSKLKIFDLKSSLEDLRIAYDSKNLKVDFMTNLTEGQLEHQKINIYRIVQEALNNIHKHANAKNVSIQLYKKAKAFQLSIEDDGVGFDLVKAKKDMGKNKSHGLINMIDRVKSMGGEIDIESDPRLGTNIIIHVNSKKYA
jgi:signal transduction histidine kinase